MTKHPINRRRMLQLSALGAAAAGMSPYLPRAAAQTEDMLRVDPKDRKLLFVLCGFGGASRVDFPSVVRSSS
jgi:hypothetical protein